MKFLKKKKKEKKNLLILKFGSLMHGRKISEFGIKSNALENTGMQKIMWGGSWIKFFCIQ